MAIKLADTLAPMADFPAVEAKDVAFNDNKSLQEKLDNGELGGGGTSITVDTSMSSTSTNPVQNKVIKAYVDSKSVDISADSDNAIQTKTDGIYVEKTKISTDDGNALSKKSDGLFVEDLSNKVNALNIAQKTINEDLDYCFVGFWNNTNSEVHATCTRGAAIPFNTKFEGNLDFNSTNKAIKLKAGHRYKLHYQCKQTGTTVNANHMERFYNETTSEWLKMACNCDTEDETHTMEEIYVPTVDCEVSVRNCWCPVASFSMRVNCVNTNPDGPGLKTIDCESAFIVTEIGKTVTIDPVEYVDSTKGIEDTPVGEIIRTIGNKTPKHYLMCDGSTHNIVDYPYLAQYFKDTFGAINVFGGDGTTTFGVPDKSTDTWWTPGLVNGVVPSPYAVYVSSVFNTTQHQKELLFDGIISADSCWHSKADGSDTDIWVKFDFGKNTYIQGLRMAARSIDYLNQLPSTFTIEGSYDDVTYTVIKSYSRLPSPTSTNFREHLFDKPVNYRYYKLNHMTSNAKNNSYDYCSIAELEFSKVDNIQYIKAEPTYYMELNQAAYINQYCDVYSTDEKIVGKWIDGRPLYRKVAKSSNYTGSTTGDIYFDSSVSDIDMITNTLISITGDRFSASFGASGGAFNTTTDKFTISGITYFKDSLSLHPSSFRVTTSANNIVDLQGRDMYLLFEYTKTTDAPNSFDYGMIMDQFAQEALVDVAVTDAEVDKCFE